MAREWDMKYLRSNGDKCELREKEEAWKQRKHKEKKDDVEEIQRREIQEKQEKEAGQLINLGVDNWFKTLMLENS